jgi:hypothetical protein
MVWLQIQDKWRDDCERVPPVKWSLSDGYIIQMLTMNTTATTQPYNDY